MLVLHYYSVTQTDFELGIFLLQPPESGGYQTMAPSRQMVLNCGAAGYRDAQQRMGMPD